jgi:hypothetical protein
MQLRAITVTAFFMYAIIMAVFLIAFSGCTAAEKVDSASSEIFYKRDIKIEYGGKSYRGIAVLPSGVNYDIKITAAGKLDLFTFTDCHMEHTAEDAGQGGIFSRKNVVDFKYSREFAGASYCPVELGGYEVKGRHSWGFIDFQSPNETLPAKIFCNGYSENTAGVSVCQSKKGLYQKIVFPVGVETNLATDTCPMPISIDSKTFEFPTVPGLCVYAFREFSGARRFHRLTTLGYDKILIREVQP